MNVPLRVAYADPPYVGKAAKHYRDHPDYAGEVDHPALIERLANDYPDGWALSCHVPSLRTLLPLCPDDVRVGAWVKPFHALKKGVRPSYGWGPVLYRGGRNPPTHKHPPPPKGGKATTPRDFIAENITLRRGLVGVKPDRVCWWIFDMLGLAAGDTLDDLYPGSGAVGRAWTAYTELAAVAARVED